jgi:hypothetical protein
MVRGSALHEVKGARRRPCSTLVSERGTVSLPPTAQGIVQSDLVQQQLGVEVELTLTHGQQIKLRD